ncbi:replication protein P [Cronobacter sakazakii]|uniref:replication protein P n=1 Tax=Cronobacter sakazakii TaxID=28141 RepID=UPI0009B24A93|nr:replication protein P [Cronobacter sakazakii]MDI7599459.1 replication protein P [Cronobacter sakazakii]MDK1037293.1 replication protein P [Cronobacter sakazakii]MDK1123317.1 replication protein P [Cronobacter sakazakii]MDQ1934108.1 replication protein P [Cronobacter sakazakii]MDQ1942544.1 replication protein P [Cronobacter sakazakii]
MKNLVQAINNRDSNALARLAENHQEPERGVNFEAEKLVDILFDNLKQLFPASVSTVLKDPRDEAAAKRQWIAAFAENKIQNKAQLKAGMQRARASESPFWPSPGQFIAWCKDAEFRGSGLPDTTELFEMVMQYCAKKCQYATPEEYPWKSNACYWMVTKLYDLMRSFNLTEPELRKRCSEELRKMSVRIESGEQIPAPVVQIPKLHIPLSNEKGLAKIAELRAKHKLRRH